MSKKILSKCELNIYTFTESFSTKSNEKDIIIC